MTNEIDTYVIRQVKEMHDVKFNDLTWFGDGYHSALEEIETRLGILCDEHNVTEESIRYKKKRYV